MEKRQTADENSPARQPAQARGYYTIRSSTLWIVMLLTIVVAAAALFFVFHLQLADSGEVLDPQRRAR